MKKKQAAAAEYDEYYHDDSDYHDSDYDADDYDYDYSRDGEEKGEDEEEEPPPRLKVPFSPYKGVLDPLVPKPQVAR